MTRVFSPVIGTGSDDTLNGSTGRDFISGYGENDDIKGLGGDDILHGGDTEPIRFPTPPCPKISPYKDS